MLPRILGMLSFENGGGGVGDAVERGAREVPLWVWLPWVSQLLLGLQRAEAPIIKQLLLHIAAVHPQVRSRGGPRLCWPARGDAGCAVRRRVCRQAACCCKVAGQPLACAPPGGSPVHQLQAPTLRHCLHACSSTGLGRRTAYCQQPSLAGPQHKPTATPRSPSLTLKPDL